MRAIGKVKNSNRFLIARKGMMICKKNNTETKTIKKIGKTTYEVVVHFNKNTTETMQDKLKRIMLREIESEKHQKNDKND
ncbi:transposon-encoded TnpW family protein [Campylobacter concisus]